MVFMLFLFAECKKTANVDTIPAADTIFKTTDSALIANFYFQPGTYWIYKDSVTGQIDSFTVTESKKKIRNYSIYGMHQSEAAVTPYNVVYITQVNINGILPHPPLYCKIVLMEQDAGFEYYTFRVPGNDDWFSVAFSYVYEGFCPDSYIFNGINYLHVATFRQNYNSSVGNTYYVCNRVGVIKMRIIDDAHAGPHVWELQRSYIKL